ncbi:MAG TPA: hypothetical protein VFP97_13975 [Chitinophagaceae bacterium]|nr:hypothetical protein [Chitinophagaceae bacterium]
MKKIILSFVTALFIITAGAQTEPTPKPPLEDFVGKYVFPDGSVVPEVDVILSDNALTMTSSAGTSVLSELGIDSFQIVEFSGIAVFKRGDDKKVNSVHIEAMGYILDGQKKSSGAWIFSYYYKPKEIIAAR